MKINEFPILPEQSIEGDPSFKPTGTTGFAKEFRGDIYSSRGRLGNGSEYVDISAIAMKSNNFVSGSTGWKIDYDGNVEFGEGTFRGDLIAGSIHIPDKTTANSFHTNTTGNSWWGCNEADFNSDNDNAKAYIKNTGVAKFENAIISGTSDIIIDTLDTSSKKILKDFNFGTTDYAGAVKSGDITWNTTTGAITSGSGIVVYRSGIVGAKAGVTTFSIDATTGDATFAGTLSAAAGTLGTVTAGTFTGCTFQTATSGERMEMGISVGGNVHNITKTDGSGNTPVMLGGVGANTEVAFRNYTASHITAIIEQTVAAAVGLYVDMGASATKAGISFSNVGSGYDIEGSSDKWHISKLGAAFFDAEMDLNTHKIVNVTDPTAAQDASTKKYHDDNPSKQTIIQNATAGEALAAWDALLISDGTETYDVSYLSADTYRDMISPTAWYGQVFKTHVCGGKITKATLKLYKQGTPTGTITCSIRATSGLNPTGSDLVTKTLNAADMPAGSTEVDFEFASPLAITGNTHYAVLLTSSDASESHFIRASRKSGNNYTDGDETIGSGESWDTYNYDWYFKVTQILTAGKVYKSEGSNELPTHQDHYIGFTESAVNKDATFDVVAGGVLAKTGLTVGKVYALKAAAGNRGEIETLASPSESNKRVGIAIKESSTVKLLVLNSYNTH